MMIMGKSLVEIFRESYTMQLLLLTSIIAIGFIFERSIFFIKSRFDYFKLIKEIEPALRKGDARKLERLAYTGKSPVHRVLKAAIDNSNLNDTELSELLSSAVHEEIAKYHKFLSALATVVAIAPLLGLYGTVVGLIKAFHNIAVTGSGGPEVVGGGIAEALLTTQFGLLIAIPSLIFYNYFAQRADDVEEYLNAFTEKILSYRKVVWNKKLDA